MRVHERSRAANILTVDYEDWFHILEPGWTAPSVWRALSSHAEEDTEALLDLLDDTGARATFFAVGWLAERTPHVVREIFRRGHRIASHGYLHVRPEEMSEAEFREDLGRSLAVLRDVVGVPVRGYRAPGFGVGGCRFPYLRILREYGLEYDASAFPGVLPGRPRYRGRCGPHRTDGGRGVWEFPVSTVRVLGIPLAFSGGGFVRVLPGWALRLCAKRVRARGDPTVYMLHPRDVNPASPMIDVPPWRRWRYYGGRRGMRRKVDDVLRRARFLSIEAFLERPVG